MVRKIEVVSYNPKWNELFLEEKEHIEKGLDKSNLVNLFHIGSTSIKGLSAKPIIDMLLVVKDIQKLDQNNSHMIRLGFTPKGEFGIKNRRYYTKGDDIRTHHIHAFQYNNLYEIERHLALRDYLRTHPTESEKYAQIKLEGAKKFQNNPHEYSKFKDHFIKQLEEKALIWFLAQKN